MRIAFGAMSKRLCEQLGLSPDELELEQKLADAIVICQIHGILTDAEVRNARKKIVRMLEKKWGEV